MGVWLGVRDGRSFWLEDNRAAAVTWEGGGIDQERAFLSPYPILDSCHDTIADDGMVSDCADQSERKTNDENAIALNRLDAFAKRGAYVSNEHAGGLQVAAVA